MKYRISRTNEKKKIIMKKKKTQTLTKLHEQALVKEI